MGEKEIESPQFPPFCGWGPSLRIRLISIFKEKQQQKTVFESLRLCLEFCIKMNRLFMCNLKIAAISTLFHFRLIKANWGKCIITENSFDSDK